jgi:branched-chain amino acid transport system permease protein
LQVLQVLISGIAQGCIYGLIALGFVLIYKASEAVSFCQGELMMLGAFLGLALLTALGLPFWIVVPSAIAAMAVFGGLAERVAIRPILGQPTFSIVLLTIGIGYVARGAVTMIPGIGTETHTLQVPYKDMVVPLGGVGAARPQFQLVGVGAHDQPVLQAGSLEATVELGAQHLAMPWQDGRRTDAVAGQVAR